jgi:hypothetical protein
VLSFSNSLRALNWDSPIRIPKADSGKISFSGIIENNFEEGCLRRLRRRFLSEQDPLTAMFDAFSHY